MEKYYSTSQFAKLICVTPQTLRNWDKNNTLKPHHKNQSGLRYYSQQQLDNYLNRYSNLEKIEKLHISYARISTQKQKTSLEKQTNRLQKYQEAKGRTSLTITDIGSGLNYNKPGLNKIIDLVLENKVETITVVYRDRLLRFGVPLLEYIFEKYGTTIEYLEQPNDDNQSQITQDVLEVLTVYTAKLNGKKAKRIRELTKELEDETNNS